MKTRTIKVQLPESHQPLLEDLALNFGMNFSDLTIACLELVGEVYTSSSVESNRSPELVAIQTKLKQNHEDLVKALKR